MQQDDTLTDRQRREIDYHRDHALRTASGTQQAVARDVISPGPRRPWNAFWSMYDHILAADLAGKRVLVPGCGYGEDAIRLAMLGAEVSAFDLSPEILAIARARAEAARLSIDFDIMPAEALTYPDDHFDAVLFVDILHHVDIAPAIAEVRRVLRPGGLVIGDELYTHSLLQRVRESWLVQRVAYRLMRRWIYGTDRPYITLDEHKIDEREFAIVRAAMDRPVIAYFGMAEGRLFPNHITWASKADRLAMRVLAPMADRLGSRVVFAGKVRKAA
jgi:SAM-dependent methyltransferase